MQEKLLKAVVFLFNDEMESILKQRLRSAEDQDSVKYLMVNVI